VMRQAVGFACCAVALKREECALSNEMRCGVVLCSGRRRQERVPLASAALVRALDPLRSYKPRSECLRGRETSDFRIATIGAVRIGLDELANREAIRCLLRGDGGVPTHSWPPFRPETRPNFSPIDRQRVCRFS
jgi:hypothetical protein